MLNSLLRHGLIPTTVIKLAIYLQIKDRLQQEKRAFEKSCGQCKHDLIQQLSNSQIALSTDVANQQHYTVPTAFFELILGPYLKYSCCWYDSRVASLAQAEVAMLKLYCQRANIKNGQRILDLGCGWGSLSLFLAKHYPDCTITAVSNSATQKAYIENQCQQHGYQQVKVMTCDVNQLTLTQQYDRIVSIEMFEHVRNYKQLLHNISQWLDKDGLLFVHHFCHDYLAYPFNSQDSWLARHFFQDGLMPSHDLLLSFQDHMKCVDYWQVNGLCYTKTCYDWLTNLYRNKNAILQIFSEHHPDPKLYFQYWVIFIRSCAQLFAFDRGKQWFVGHYLFNKVS